MNTSWVSTFVPFWEGVLLSSGVRVCRLLGLQTWKCYLIHVASTKTLPWIVINVITGGTGHHIAKKSVKFGKHWYYGNLVGLLYMLHQLHFGRYIAKWLYYIVKTYCFLFCAISCLSGRHRRVSKCCKVFRAYTSRYSGCRFIPLQGIHQSCYALWIIYRGEKTRNPGAPWIFAGE